MRNYRLTKKADRDLVDIYLYGAEKFGIAQAEAYFAELRDCFALQAAQPDIARERTELKRPVRIHFHKAHVIAFQTDSDIVTIIRILGNRQHWQAVHE